MKLKKIKNINSLRVKIKRNFSIGTWLQLSSPEVAEIISTNNYDWLAVDLEHGSISIEKLTDIFRAIEKNKTLPFARLQSKSKYECLKVLEAGAQGIIIPQIKNSKELENIIKHCSYPPLGKRGIGFSRSNLYGKELNKKVKIFQPYFVAMIENKEAIKNLDKILKTKGLDAIFIGPYDLSASINKLGDFKSKKFLKILKHILQISKKNKIPCGLHLVEPNKINLSKAVKNGYKFIAFSIDTVFLAKASQI